MANSISDIFGVLFALGMFPTLRTQSLFTLGKKISDKEFQSKKNEHLKTKCPGGSQKENGTDSKVS